MEGRSRSAADLRILPTHGRPTPKRTRPDVFVAVDFPGLQFHARTGIGSSGSDRLLHQPAALGLAAGPDETMRRIADQVLVIFPFEETIYRDAGVPVSGSAIRFSTCAAPPDRGLLPSRSGLDPDATVVALLPGSRRNEVRAILPDLVPGGASFAASSTRNSSSHGHRTSLMTLFAPIDAARRGCPL